MNNISSGPDDTRFRVSCIRDLGWISQVRAASTCMPEMRGLIRYDDRNTNHMVASSEALYHFPSPAPCRRAYATHVCLSVCLSVWQVAPRHLVKRSSSRLVVRKIAESMHCRLLRSIVGMSNAPPPLRKSNAPLFLWTGWYIHSYPVGTFRNGWEQSMNTYTSL